MTLESVLTLKTLVVGAWFLMFFIGERVRAAAPADRNVDRLFANGGFWLLTLVVSPLIVVPLTHWGANHVLWQRPEALASGVIGIAAFAFSLLLLDLWTYWLHRAYHRIPFMWRFHQVHHRDEHLDSTSALRFHFGEVILSALLRLVPVAVLALPFTVVIAYESLLLCAAIFHHSNVRLPAKLERALSYVVVTPSIHWVHHHATDADTNSNFSVILSLWDRLFGSRSSTERNLHMKIGIEGVEDKRFLRLLLMPFLRNEQ